MVTQTGLLGPSRSEGRLSAAATLILMAMTGALHTGGTVSGGVVNKDTEPPRYTRIDVGNLRRGDTIDFDYFLENLYPGKTPAERVRLFEVDQARRRRVDVKPEGIYSTDMRAYPVLYASIDDVDKDERCRETGTMPLFSLTRPSASRCAPWGGSSTRTTAPRIRSSASSVPASWWAGISS